MTTKSFYLFGMSLMAMVLFGASAANAQWVPASVFGVMGVVLIVGAYQFPAETPESLRKKAVEMLREGSVTIVGKATGITHSFDYVNERGAWQHTKFSTENPPRVYWKNVHEATSALYTVLLENCIEEKRF